MSEIKTEKDVREKVFGNTDLEIIYEDQVFENIFYHPKSLEIRRYSKIIKMDNWVVFLGFR
jgi:hypothetical protein